MRMVSQRGASSFDWASASQRLQQLADALAEGEQLSAERARALMDARARALAQVPEEASHGGEVVEVLEMVFAGERFAVETRFVREVFRAPTVTPVPGAPDFVLGVTNLRGEVLPVVDLSRLFGLGRVNVKDHTRLVVFGQERTEFGVPADEITTVGDLRVVDVLEPSGALSKVLSDLCQGVTRDGLLLLDGETMIRHECLIIDDALHSRLPNPQT